MNKETKEAQAKYTKFADIPQFTRSGSYAVNVSWDYLEQTLNHWAQTEIKGGGLELDPDFQRAHVWTEEKQIAFVEYCLRGGKSSRRLFFNCSSWMGGFDTPVQLVDGKQRLEAVRRFLHGEIPAFGTYYKDYTDRVRVATTDFIFEVNDLKTRKEVLQWYLDLNTGGVVHTTEEINKVKALLAEETSK